MGDVVDFNDKVGGVVQVAERAGALECVISGFCELEFGKV